MVVYIGLMCLLMLNVPTITLSMVVYTGVMCLLMLDIANHYSYNGGLHWFDVFVDAQRFQSLHFLW